MRTLFIAIITASSLACGAARQPSWVSKPPRGYTNDFFVGEGTAETKTEAKQLAVASAMARISQRDSLAITSREVMGESIATSRTQQGQGVSVEQRLTRETISEGTSGNLKDVLVVEEFGEDGQGRANSWVLVSAPKRSGVRRVPTRGEAVLRSLIVPGWGQYTLGYERTGLSLGAGVLVAVPTGVALLNAQRHNRRLADATLIQASRIEYANKANALGVIANVTLAAAASAWVFSVVNATSAPFKLYVDASPSSKGFGLQFDVAHWLQAKNGAVQAGGSD